MAAHRLASEMAADEAREPISGRPVPIPLGIRLSIPERRRIIRALSAQGVSVGRLAELFAVSKTTVYRYLGSTTPFKHDLESVMEAGLAWYARYRSWPTSEAWNSSLARGDESLPRTDDRIEAYARYLAGYHPVLEPGVLRAWPRPADIAKLYRSRECRDESAFETYRRALRAEIRRRKCSGEPYEVIPLNPGHEFVCRVRGFNPSLPPELRADVDGQTRRMDWFSVLLSVAGLIDFREELLRLYGPGRVSAVPHGRVTAVTDAGRDGSSRRWDAADRSGRRGPS
jgi:DNA-binding transcriptional ArsR family regulator